MTARVDVEYIVAGGCSHLLLPCAPEIDLTENDRYIPFHVARRNTTKGPYTPAYAGGSKAIS